MPPAQRRRFHTNSKKYKKLPETANDFLSAGIEYEESGDRWRPGDKPKAGRFYQRAIEAYQSCLKLNPRSFDAAYNKARLEFKISQERELVSKRELRGVLERALESHRVCLGIDKNEDALFNTAQAYSSLGEAVLNEDKNLAVKYLTEACEMFNVCFERQQAIFASYTAPAVDEEEMDTESGGVSLSEEVTMSDPAAEEGYVVIQPPITPSTLLDTLLELLSTLSILLPIHPSPQPLINTTTILLSQTLPSLSTSLLDREHEYLLTAAITTCAIAESVFRSSPGADASAWETTITTYFTPVPTSSDALCAKSDAHVSLASTVSSLAWKHYAFASAALGEAAKLEPKNGRVYLAQGDMELVRSRIECAARTEEVRGLLRRNAGVFYRGAMRVGDAEVGREAGVKEAAVRFEDGDVDAVRELLGKEARDVLEEALEEEVFGGEILERIEAAINSSDGSGV
ncbi:hypothetical protein BDD12DRAFT_871855 [Trichophaea hybrida]|nr:hypothetical protein BDD12DRAFT_871855 [Trichophaea hybrida]